MTTPTLTLEQGRDALYWCDSYKRLPTLMQLWGAMSLQDWRTLLGEEWQMCDNIGTYGKKLKLCMFPTATPHTCPEMMTQQEQQALAALPLVVTIYRGCGPANMIGCCWSLDRDVAAGFPLMNRYHQRDPLLISATVKRDRIVALKLDREEQEVITFNARRVSVESLAVAPMAE
jgi:hypothetical protein